VLMANHGLLVASDDFEEARTLTARTVDTVNQLTRAVPSPKAPPPHSGLNLTAAMASLRGALLRLTHQRFIVRAETSSLSRWVASPTGLPVTRIPALNPDEITYCRRLPMMVTKRDLTAKDPASAIATGLDRYLKKHRLPPKVAVLANMGLAGVGSTPQAADAAIEMCLSAVGSKLFANRFGGAKPLTRTQAEYIETWEVEKFRRSLMETCKTQPLAGRIAFVTGAASGLGRNLAIGLSKAGALVGCADIDMAGLTSTVEEIGVDRAIPLRTNVTDETSVAEAMAILVSSFGGLDVIVNAAGIAPSHPLVDFPVEHWTKTLEINLTGYFLVAREAARIFMKQGAGGSIVNISSKTGLEASVNNSAYNATKAGEIHLARGWALELGKHGIRVNAIAPGNVFRGSKIWNAQYIRDCARKKGIKPEEVIPYYIGLSALRKEIVPEDIINGVTFLASDAAANITGQTLVIDGGQVLVR